MTPPLLLERFREENGEQDIKGAYQNKTLCEGRSKGGLLADIGS